MSGVSNGKEDPITQAVNDDWRRSELVRRAVEAADRILMDGADGTTGELDYLTARVAERFATKVLHAATSALHRRMFTKAQGGS